MPFIHHLSVRVPWHDNDWSGTVCKRPRENGACTALPEIAKSKQDEAEACIAGRQFIEITEDELPPCVGERASFMAPFSLRRSLSHPYKHTDSVTHQDLRVMGFQLPPFSAACIPFKWMRREFADDLSQAWRLDYDPGREPTDPTWLSESGWVQDGRNQRAMLDGFFSTIKPEQSLCFFYAKRTPFSDDPRRVIVGVGRVTNVGKPLQYEREDGPTEVGTSYVWDVSVQHSIRPKDGDGFLMPYSALASAQEAGANIDWERCLAFSPVDHLPEFSYVSERVSQDGAISALLECKIALENAKEFLHQVDEINRALRWIDSRISELWKLRGAYPGLGAALTAFGVPNGNFLALHLAERLNENDDPWPLVDQLMRKPASLPSSLAKLVTTDVSDTWKTLKESRLALLKLLARFALTNEQATRFYVKAVRNQCGIISEDLPLLENPYLIYEEDRFSVPATPDERLERVTVETIDRGAFPADVVATKHPLPEQTRMTGPRDKRRIRGLIIAQLEIAALAGHTLMPESQIIVGIRNAKLDPPCPISEDVLDAVAKFLPIEVVRVILGDEKPALQLQRYLHFKKLLSSKISVRAKQGGRFNFSDDWRARVDSLLPPIDLSDIDEVRAREEKAAALSELASSRFSVLVGPAGAGKTTVLKALCQHEQIAAQGVVLLAPTGKARVQLAQKCGHDAQTLAQFLMVWGKRYDSRTGVYRTVPGAKFDGAKTIIVDEASMLTEDMVGALFDAVIHHVDRLIMVGDPRQLPPIGAGKPFFDAVTFLTPMTVAGLFPKIGTGYAELTVQRRHKASGHGNDFPLDLQLANWFAGKPLAPGEDEIWSILGGLGDKSGRVITHRWDSTEELRNVLMQTLCKELNLSSIDDQRGFAQSYGGQLKDNYVYFNPGAATNVENWQVLTPLRNDVFGARDINRLLHRTFRKGAVAWAASRAKYRARITPPRGPEEIVYGDKVINIRNHVRTSVSPRNDSLEYIANGEIGVVIGELVSAAKGTLPQRTKVEFSSQPGFVYNFRSWDFDEESSPLLELAYAVTVHKAQGSEFDTTILVLPQKSRLVSREMVYTALTRQKQRVVILHQGELSNLRKLASDDNAVIPARFTNLFEKESPSMLPIPIEVSGKWMDGKLIHRSRRGTLLRSKSEVIIDDALAHQGIEAGYEVPFYGTDGQQWRLPDFTIDDQSIGRKILWEHCGMLSDAGYRKRWENKLEWYRKNGVRTHEEGGGARATLVVTYDDDRGGIDVMRIDALVAELFG